MTRIFIISNALSMEPEIELEATDPIGALMNRFPKWPKRARIHKGAPKQFSGAPRMTCLGEDITPDGSEESLLRVAKAEAVTVVIEPSDPATMAAIGTFLINNWVAVAVVTATTIGALVLVASIPSLSQGNNRPGSANNKLAGRTNEFAIPGSRIADIYGQVRSYPKIWSIYSRYDTSHREVELMLADIGRGSYSVETIDGVPQIKDGETLVSDIAGAKVAIFAPGTSPNSGVAEVTVGGSISEPVASVRRMNELNGQDLDAPNKYQIAGEQLEYEYIDSTTGVIRQTAGSPKYDFSDYFSVGSVVDLIAATVGAIDLTGSGYTVAAVASNLLTLDNPNSINSEWNGDLAADGDQKAQINGSIVRKISEAVVGPFVADLSDNGRVSLNFVARSGLYKTDGSTQERVDVQVRVTLQPIDADGADQGAAQTFTGTVLGSTTSGDARALTLVADPSFSQRCKVTIKRLTDTDHDYSGTVIDEVKIAAGYVLTPVAETSFGDVTLIQSETVATESATANKERKLNLVATRRFPRWISGTTFTSELFPTKNIADLISAAALDEYVGRLPSSEIDFENLYETAAAIQQHFQVVQSSFYVGSDDVDTGTDLLTETAHGLDAGQPFRVVGAAGLTEGLVYYFGVVDADTLTVHLTREAALAGTGLVDINGSPTFLVEVLSTGMVEFCHTLDSDQISFEDTVKAIAAACHCEIYRNASNQISLNFEKATSDSELIFNHRNVIPGSMIPVVKFGNVGNADGVEIRYRDPVDDSETVFYLPADRSAVQPKVITMVGVRNFNQVYFLAWRQWNKIRYGNETVSFTTLPHGELLKRMSRVLVSDITRLSTLEGYVISQTGTAVEISQDFDPVDGVDYTMFMQQATGLAESRAVTSGGSPRSVVLGSAPSESLVTGDNKVMKTTYIIADDASDRPLAYLVTSRTAADGMNWAVTATAYRDEFYANDADTPA
jgi:hypothetical protein